MGIPLYQVNSFTAEPFKGNPACVCILEKKAAKDWMQSLARERNVVRTAFVCRLGNRFSLRWFSPLEESGLCGHATLAAAHILWTEGYVEQADKVSFQTSGGLLRAWLEDKTIQLDFPSLPVKPVTGQKSLLSDIRRFLGCSPQVDLRFLGKSGLAYLAELESAEVLRGIKPDFKLMEYIPGGKLIVTSASDKKDFDFISRFFTQGANGEDQATGSAHCSIGPYWADRLGKVEMVGYQASERGGVVKVKVSGDRVILAGKAVTTFKGRLMV